MISFISLRLRTLTWAVAAVSAIAGPAAAQFPFDELIVFGDSWSDNGNANILSAGLAATPPYWGARLSNGPLWVERLAERLNLGHPTENNPVPAPSLAGGTNYAFGGAATGPGLSNETCVPVNGVKTCVPNIGTQIETFFEDGRTFSGDELVFIQGGGNNKSARNAAVELADHVATLAAAGGEFFVVPNLERLSQYPSPDYKQTSRWDHYVDKFNTELEEELVALEGTFDITIIRLDMLGLTDAIINDPAAFGFLNVTDPACLGCGFGIPAPDAVDTIVPNPDEYLYWDTVHFTTVAHRIFGDAAANEVEAAAHGIGMTAGAVPEPATLALLLFTIVGALVVPRHRLAAKNHC